MSSSMTSYDIDVDCCTCHLTQLVLTSHDITIIYRLTDHIMSAPLPFYYIDASRITQHHAFIHCPFCYNAPSAQHQHSLDEGIYSSAEDHEIHRIPHCAGDRFPDQQFNGFMIRINRHTSRARQ